MIDLISFHHQRTPLIILICGERGVGKSTLSQKLAELMNLPSALQTDIMFDLALHMLDTKMETFNFSNESAELDPFQMECEMIQHGKHVVIFNTFGFQHF